ncbi:TPA: hypothetical protein ACXIGT_001318 [Serratia marcescens]|uniref:hypothetical protein n=1 Tax=Serratia TaxID=613 RepID=UPI002DBB5987|nr:hypothetical protein [Serratia ureilytica]MEB5993149.1 hypothetical protein [Serratia ureilytica]
MLDYDFKTATYNIAKHEAGHWLCANSLGWSPRDIVVRVPSHPKGHYGYALNAYRTSLAGIEDVREYSMGRVKVLYSGAYAENFNGDDFDHDQVMSDLMRGGGANSDFLKAEEIYFFYYNCLSNPRGWEIEFNPIICDVQLLIDMRYHFIDAVGRKFEKLAYQMGQELTMTRDELIKIYQDSPIRLSHGT